MLYTLKNDKLTVQISDKGAELMSVLGADGCEYLWQGDDRYWASRAPWMFPVCGRLYHGRYACNGKEYELPNHGFARHSLFELTAQSDDSVTLTLTANEQTKALYPFDFAFSVTYRLTDSTLQCTLSVKNTGNATLPFAVGAHPGFCAPINKNGSFEDCYLEFSAQHTPSKILFTENLLTSGDRAAYPLRDGRFIDLTRDFFAADATFLADTCGEVTLRSRKDAHTVTLRYPDFAYVGIWTKTDDGADYVCIEPWCGLPGRDGGVEELIERADLFKLPPNAERTVSLDLVFA